eukprot:TRINITY_DN3035_c0_g1_i1.p1 TRINITY_DN3035_c0_g1~~TRINITY_DN3035_c0_g1_i1.p1  ORF type:complete len:107 (-),score=22.63 TRINITY_DN3035_c0_g1_i1:27-347(-)
MLEKNGIEFDVWIPSLNLAFEYQGEQHYFPITAFSANTDAYNLRDKEKDLLCLNNGITLVQIPYWWKGDLDSLTQSILSKDKNLVSYLSSSSSASLSSSSSSVSSM